MDSTRFLRFTAAVLSVVVLTTTAILQPGILGTLGLFVAAGIFFLTAIVFALYKAGEEAERRNNRVGKVRTPGTGN